MITLRFPTSRIVPVPDPTERCMHEVIDVANDFAHAIAEAPDGSRLIQLRQRLGVCVALLMDLERAARIKGDALGWTKEQD